MFDDASTFEFLIKQKVIFHSISFNCELQRAPLITLRSNNSARVGKQSPGESAGTREWINWCHDRP